ncbi:N-acetylneuraminate synthase family protein [Candidatus Nitrosopelagicus sp.]|nr:N-acetylneuraminate synthase family protein [Candidatus Nitrosopelagicus sp.]
MNSNVKIGNKVVGKGNPCLISFEPSATYADFDEAKRMIELTALSGADAIKFQTFLPNDSDRIMGDKSITIDFTTENGKKQELVYDALKRRELSKDDWKKLIIFSKQQNLLFITAPYFPETIDFLSTSDIDAFKVSKGDINNVLLIDKMAKTGIPIILDAREKLDDIERAVSICEENNNQNIIIMHCPSGYPSKNSGVHLNAIKFLQDKYQYPIAFADHSRGGIMNYAAVALNVTMLEKTITTNTKLEHVEHFMSLETSELKEFVQNIRMIEEALGNHEILSVSRVEESARRSLVAKKSIDIGEKISLEHLDFRRPGDQGISCQDGFSIIGKTSKQKILKDEFLEWNMFE